MKNYLFWFFSIMSFNLRADMHDDEKCAKIISALDESNRESLEQLFAFKKLNAGTWIEHKIHGKIAYTLAPEKMTTYEFSWKVKNGSKQNAGLVDGSLRCEVPDSWILTVNSPVTITYPAVSHNHKQELTLHSVETVAGIYLAKSNVSSIKDFLTIMWHLRQEDIAEKDIDALVEQYDFLKDNFVVVTRPNLDMESSVQLVALHVSNQEDIGKDNPKWLVATAEGHKLIADGGFKTSTSRYDALLPWFDPMRPEFSSGTPKEAYDTSVVAPLEALSLFDREEMSFVRDPLAAHDKGQMVYDAIAPFALKFARGSTSLFAHVVFKQPNDYKFLTFEILPDGAFVQRAMRSLKDTSQIDLPSARELGFALNGMQ